MSPRVLGRSVSRSRPPPTCAKADGGHGHPRLGGIEQRHRRHLRRTHARGCGGRGGGEGTSKETGEQEQRRGVHHRVDTKVIYISSRTVVWGQLVDHKSVRRAAA